MPRASRSLPGPGRLLLVVDQLEELFALASTDDQARFIAALAGIHELDVSIVFAIRADFYGELMESALWPLVEDGKIDVPPLAGDALSDAIEKPATSCHVTIEPDLLERLVSDAGSEPGALPLLQEALVRLWGTMRLHRISLAAYESIGGEGRRRPDGRGRGHRRRCPRGALARPGADRQACARSGSSSSAKVAPIRAASSESRSCAARATTTARSRMCSRCSPNARLVTLTGAASPAATAGLQGRRPRRPRARGADRRRGRRCASGWPSGATPSSRADGSRDTSRRGRSTTARPRSSTTSSCERRSAGSRGPDARELGIPRGLSELVAVSAARLRRRRRLRRGAIAGLVGLTLAAIVLAGVFLRARNDAIHKANVAVSRERAASALAALSVDPQRSLRLALQAVDAFAADDSATPEDRLQAEEALRTAVRESQVRAVLKGHTAEVVSASFDPGGRRILTASRDGTARLWDAATGEPGVVLRAGKGRLETASFSPDGTRVVTAGPGRFARVWDARTGDPLLELRHAPRASVLDAAFGADGRLVVTAGSDGTARVWNARTGKPTAVLGKLGGPWVWSAVLNPEGSRVATGDQDGNAVVWSTATRKPLARLRHGDTVTSVRFGPGDSIVTASDDDTARIWRPFARRPTSVVLRGHKGKVTDAEFSPGGARVVTASLDGTARVWSASTGRELTVPLAHDGALGSASFSRDGIRIVTASADKTARIWDSHTGRELTVLRGHTSYVGSAAFNRDGTRIVTSSFDRTARVWDATEGEPAVTLGRTPDGNRFEVATAALSLDGNRVVTTSPVGEPRILDATTGRERATLAVDGARVVGAAFTADGREVVTADAAAGVRIWDAATGRSIGSRMLTGDPVIAIPSPVGARVLSVSVGTVRPIRRNDRRAVGPHAREAGCDLAHRGAWAGSGLRRERQPRARVD